MNIIQRVKNILVNPKQEWEVIDGESATVSSLFTGYVLPLIILGAIAAFIGYGFIGIDMFGLKISGMKWGMFYALNKLIVGIIAYYISVYVVDMLANSFASEKNLNKSAQLVAYGTTPAMVGGLFYIFPLLGILAILFAIYSIYIWYLGLGPIKKTPEDKKVVYIVVSILVYIVAMILLGMIVNMILQAVLGVDTYSGMREIKIS
jgi:hypothetical protein